MQLIQFIVNVLKLLANVSTNREADIDVQDIATLTTGRHIRNATVDTENRRVLVSPDANSVRPGDCDPIIVPLGINKIKLTPRPIGQCDYCCHIKLRKDILLLLYTQQNPTTAVQLSMRTGNLKRAGLNPDFPTIVYVHGFIEVCRSDSSSYAIRDAYLRLDTPHNVILVDWTNLSAGPWYGQAAENTIIVADYLARFLKSFHSTGELSIDQVHLIGFSLGAQIIGMTGKYLRGWRLVNRITGLDPAQPLYPIKDVAHRIAKDDAEFVDVIHTNPMFLGYNVSIGHADFYVNPGRDFQPGCNFRDLVLRNQIDDFFSCSHQRAWNVYVETISNPQVYPAYKCNAQQENCQFHDVFMGYNVSRNCRGDYYVTTT